MYQLPWKNDIAKCPLEVKECPSKYQFNRSYRSLGSRWKFLYRGQETFCKLQRILFEVQDYHILFDELRWWDPGEPQLGED